MCVDIVSFVALIVENIQPLSFTMPNSPLVFGCWQETYMTSSFTEVLPPSLVCEVKT